MTAINPTWKTPRSRVSIAFGAIAALVAVALLSLVWTPFDPTAVAVDQRLQPPSALHWLGSDAYGRDVLSAVMAGARSALAVAAAACALGMGVGVPLGLLAAARRGWTEELVMRTGDLVFAFPALLLAVLLAAALGPGALNAVVAIGVFSIPVFARVTRAEALRLWTRDFILAARLAGKGPLRLSVEHILPNLAGPLAVQGAIQFSLAVVADAGLSYVGLGVQPPQPSWGRMLADAQTLYTAAPWLALAPGLAIVLTVLAFFSLGEALRIGAARREGA